MEQVVRRRPACCGDEECGRAVYMRLVSPNEPLEHDVDSLAVEIAHSCPWLSAAGLADCFSHVFDLTPECRLFDHFSAAFSAARGRARKAEPREIPRR